MLNINTHICVMIKKKQFMKLRSNLVAMGVIGLKEEGVEMMSIQYSYLKT